MGPISIPPVSAQESVSDWQMESPLEHKEVWHPSVVPSTGTDESTTSHSDEDDKNLGATFPNEWTKDENNSDRKSIPPEEEPFVPITGFEDPKLPLTPEELDREARRATAILNARIAHNEKLKRRPNY